MTQVKSNPGTDRAKAADRVASTLPAALALLGSLLIVASLLPIGDWAAKSQWTPEDSAAYDRVSTEYKRSNYQSAARLGISETEQQAQREKMKSQLDAMRTRLDRARDQPQRWSRYLLWTGVLLTATGFFAHSIRQS